MELKTTGSKGEASKPSSAARALGREAAFSRPSFRINEDNLEYGEVGLTKREHFILTLLAAFVQNWEAPLALTLAKQTTDNLLEELTNE